ncbi:serine/threonine protein kinase [Treponema sp.]
MRGNSGSQLPDFSPLSPSYIAEAAEAVLGQRVDGTLVPYPSYVNRVYGLQTEDGRRVIAKFYRPGRWSEASLRQEHAFMADCANAGLPVLAPLCDEEGETLSALSVEDEESGEEQFYYFSLYPFVHRPGWEATSDRDWLALGSLIAKIHEVGRLQSAPDRPSIHPASLTKPALQSLISQEYVHPELRTEFTELCLASLDRLIPLFDTEYLPRLHGDLHRGNLLQGSNNSMVLIDFDDMASGPAIQDLWLFLPGRLDESRKELNLIIEGYEEQAVFDHGQIELIEGLRFMRMVSYLAWQARQIRDRGFFKAFPDWGSRAFWIKELEDLRDQARVIFPLAQP